MHLALFHLVYVSSAVEPFSDAELLRLLERSRAKNAAVNVSGMLLYEGGTFMQVLEGEEPAVREVHDRITRDPRHCGLLTLLQGPIEKRAFSEWSMGFRNLDSTDFKPVAGYSEFMNLNWRGDDLRANPGRALK